MENAIFSVFPIILDDEVYWNPGNLILTGSYATALICVNEISNFLFLCIGESVRSGFFPKFFYSLTHKFNCYAVNLWCRGILIPWYRGVVVSRLVVLFDLGVSGFCAISGCSLKDWVWMGVGDSIIGLDCFSGDTTSTDEGIAALVKNNDAPSSSLVMFSVFSLFFINQKARVWACNMPVQP